MDTTTHGGVGHLLKMAKTQCAAAVAFAALRKPDGGFAIATFPNLTSDPTWTVEAIDDLVRQTWEDPLLTGGQVVVRSARVLRGLWSGQAHATKLAAAALADPDALDRPWGLLCVAEPLVGHFEQDQLNLLASLAARLAAYLRARQELLEPIAQGAGSQSAAQPQGEPSAAEPAPANAPVPPSPAAEGGLAASAPSPTVLGATALEAPVPAQGAPGTSPQPAPGGSWDTGAPSAGAQGSAEPQPRVEQQAEWVEARPEAERPFAAPAAPPPAASEGAVPALDTLLGPDPATGLPTLPTLLGFLGEGLGRIRNGEGAVALIVLTVSPVDGAPLPDSAALAIAGRLRNRVREHDLVARVAPGLFAVATRLRTAAVDPETIRERLVSGITGATSNAGELTGTSAVALATPEDPVGPEELFRRATDRLGFP